MFDDIYGRLLGGLAKTKLRESVIFKHLLNFINKTAVYNYKRQIPYEEEEPNQIVVDYIASMTDDYFIGFACLSFPEKLLENRVHFLF